MVWVSLHNPDGSVVLLCLNHAWRIQAAKAPSPGTLIFLPGGPVEVNEDLATVVTKISAATGRFL